MCKRHDAVVGLSTPFGHEKLEVHLRRCLHRIFHQLEVGVVPMDWYLHLQCLHRIGQPLIVRHTPRHRLFRPVENGTEGVPIFLVRLLHPSATHVFGLAVEGQTVVVGEESGEGVGQCFAKLTLHEAMQFVLLVRPFHPFPCHVEKVLYQILRWLDVAHIQHPHLADAALVGFGELLPHQEGGKGAEPEVVVRSPPIGNMII